MAGLSPFRGLPFTVPLKYQGTILFASARWDIPANVLASQIQQESNFEPNVTSSAGAEGIAQFEPGTARSLGVDPWNPHSAIDGMAHLDRNYVQQFGSIELALAAYNAGPDAVINAGNKIPAISQTENYVSTILANAGRAGSTGATGIDVGGIGTTLDSEFSGLADLTKGSVWSRVGKGALGVAAIGAGAYFLISKQPGSFKPVRDLVNSG